MTVVQPDLPEADYHAIKDRLSSSRAKVLLQEGGPAKFKWELDNPEPEARKTAFDVGSAVHSLILGGPELVEVEAEDWKTKAAQTRRKEIAADNGIPLLTSELAMVNAVADAVHNHPEAADLLGRDGQPEVTIKWDDAATDVPLKARLDYLCRSGLIIDLKTTADASPSVRGFPTSAARYFYDLQAAWYCEAVRQATCYEPAFVFVVVEKVPPYEVITFEPDDEMLRVGGEKMRHAIDIYARCLKTGEWPGYPTGIQPLSLPRWAVTEWITQ